MIILFKLKFSLSFVCYTSIIINMSNKISNKKNKLMTTAQEDFASSLKTVLFAGENCTIDKNSSDQVTINVDLSNVETELDNKQNLLISGVNLKTVSNQSLIGPGNLQLTKNNISGLGI